MPKCRPTVPRRGSRIQKGGGGVRTFRRGGGGSYRNFRSGSKLLQGPGQINKQNKIADSRRGGGGGVRSPPKKPLYPRMVPQGLIQSLQNVNKRKHVCPKFPTQVRLSCFQSPLPLSLPDKAHTISDRSQH